jgi:GT2 family glycosyltransferase
VSPAKVSPQTTPLVSVVVVNHNGGSAVAACVESLLASRHPQELFVVDSASTDGSRELLQRLASHEPRLRLILHETNCGYAGGINEGAALAQGKYLACLNADVVVEPAWLEPLVAFLERNPQAGAVNPLVLLADGTRINAKGQDIHVSGVPSNRFLGRPREAAGSQPVRIRGIHGCAFVVRREALERLGGMDTHGFLYHEDVNLSWALQLMGYALYCVPASTVRHDYSLSMHPAKLHLLERNRWTCLMTFLDPPALVAILPALMVTEMMTFLFCMLRGWPYLRAKLGACWWAVRHGWPHVRQRRQAFAAQRVGSSWRLLRGMRWAFAWDQLLALSTERLPKRERFTMPAVQAFDATAVRSAVSSVPRSASRAVDTTLR